MKRQFVTHWPMLAVAAAAVLVSSRLGGAHKAGQEALKPIASGIGKAWASVSMALNGSHRIDFVQAGFYLNERYIDEDFKVAAFWVESIEGTHPDHPAMLGKLLDSQGRIKAAYRGLIGTTITKEALGL